MREGRIIQIEGGHIVVNWLTYKTVSVASYWGYLNNGHLIGYSKDLETIKKRIRKHLEKRGEK